MASKPATFKQQLIAHHALELRRHQGVLAYGIEKYGDDECAKAAPGTKIADAKTMIPFHEQALGFLTNV